MTQPPFPGPHPCPPLDYALALLLITAPGDVGDPGRFATVRPTVRAVAAGLQLLDPRERPYVLARPGDLAGDLRLVRGRREALADAPPLEDHMRFPGRALVCEMLAANRAWRARLVQLQALEPGRWGDLQEMVLEADRLYRVWDLVRDAGCEYYYVSVRRQALKALRELAGEEAYQGGALPAAVPWWRFGRID